jgi:hypothetical protein
MEKTIVKDEAIKFCSILPELFSDDFDRKTLWERIGNGITASVKKCGGDYEEFVNLVLEYIKADHGKLASNDGLSYFLKSMETKNKDWHDAFIRIMSKKSKVVLVYARNLWNSKKGGVK